jgi:hypothetical protein
MDGRFTPQTSEQGISLFGQLPQALPSAARVFARNHAHVTGQRLCIDKPGRVAHEHFGRERGDRPDAGMRHQPTGLRPLLRLGTDLLIEIVNLRGQMIMKRLER